MRGFVLHRVVRWLVVVSILLVASSAWAQTTGRVRVTVVDQDDLPVPGAELTLAGENLLGGALHAMADDRGEHMFVELPPGRYELEVSSAGWRVFHMTQIQVYISRVTQIRAHLEPAELEELVVDFHQKAVDVERSSRSQVLTKEFLQKIPAGRTHQAAINITAGVQPGVGGNASVGETRAQPARATLRADDPPTCDPEQPQQWWVSPDDSNSMSAPVLQRVVGFPMPPLAARRWEFFNYAQWDYPPAEPGKLGIEAQLARADDDDTYAMQVAVTSPRVGTADRDPMSLTFVLDTSCSMSGHPIELTRQILRDISSQLRDGDIVSMVTWDTTQSVRLRGHRVAGPRDPQLSRAIDALNSDGGTDLHAGLRAGYALASEHAAEGRIDRVVLVSDGQANVGVTDEELIGAAAGSGDVAGIYLIGVGVGDRYNDQLMERVTDLGRGASVYVPDEAESARMFGQRFLETVSVAARDVQIRYDLPPGLQVQLETFSGEEISTEQADVEPQHIAPNDAMVLHQQLRACAPLDPDALIGVTVTYRDAVTFEAKLATRVWRVRDLLGRPTPQLDKGAALVALTEALQSGSDEVRHGAARALEQARRSNPDDPDLGWMEELLGR